MNPLRTIGMPACLLAALALGALATTGCEKKTSSNKTSSTGTHDDHGHAHSDGHSHDHADGGQAHDDDHDHADGDHDHDHDHGHGGATIDLGAATIGAFDVTVSRDEGEIKPGGEIGVDLHVTQSRMKIGAVRFWIGVQDGEGSVKVLAAVEKGVWHAHVEAPSPLPEGSRLWVEMEDETGAKSAGAFDLK